LVDPPTDAAVFALALPLFVSAGAVHGTAVAAARAGAGGELYYLVDNALADGPPVWVQEGEIERCVVAALPVREET
jgi:hypothetical protein